MTKTIVFDPGHGAGTDSDRGFYGTGTYNHEGKHNFLMYCYMRDYLKERYDVEIKSTRKLMNDEPWPGRGSMFGKVDLFCSIHTNAYNGTVRGSEVYVPTGSPQSAQLAYEICKKSTELFGTYDKFEPENPHINRGVKNGDDYTVIQEAKSTGTPLIVLMELGFHDNPTDAKYLIEQDRILCAHIAETIAQFMKLEVLPKPVQPVATVPATTAPYGYIYALRVGSAKVKNNLESAKQKAIVAGFPGAYIELVPYSKEPLK